MNQKGFIEKIYGRRQARGLRAGRARLYDETLPRLAAPSGLDGPVDPASLFPGAAVRRIWLEVGFGGGEHLAWHAERRPDVGFIGAEPFLDGVGKLLSLVEDRGLTNVRVLHGDARPLIEALPDASLDRIFVLHPDPWPKRRHFKRRLVSPWFFAEAARTLAPGGLLRVASDIPDYVRWTLMHWRDAPAFDWLAEHADDWRVRPDDWPQTRYEAKALREGRPATYLQFRRRSADIACDKPASA